MTKIITVHIKVSQMERPVKYTRRILLHSSAAGFAADFIHAIIGKTMIFAQYYERIHDPLISWSALAATLIVYIDGAKEKYAEEHKDVPHDTQEGEVA
jgi:hypothetical protein